VRAKLQQFCANCRWLIGTVLLYPLACLGVLLSIPLGLLEVLLDTVGEGCDSLEDWRLGYKSPYRRWFRDDSPWGW
jgi:hypothetical protein